MKQFISDASSQYKHFVKIINKLDKKLLYKLAVVLASVLLLSITAYSATKAGEYFSTSSDAIVYPYLFGEGLHRHTIALPGAHTNLLKFPLFFVEGKLPYHYHTFLITGILLSVISIAAWAYLLIKLFGKKYALLILVFLSVLMFTSIQFNINLGETTSRNIEFPIALFFVLIVSDILKGVKTTRKTIAIGAVGCLLYCLTLAGDNFFEYAISLPTVVVIGWYWLMSRRLSRQMIKAVGLVIGLSIGALILKLALTKSGVIVDYNSPAASIVNYRSLWDSIGTAWLQLLGQQGASIFGIKVGFANFGYFVNFLLSIAGIVGLIFILVATTKSYRKSKGIDDNNHFVFATLAASFFAIFWAYVLSGKVVQVLGNGQVVNLNQARYLDFMALISLVGVVWIIKVYYRSRALLLAIIIIVSLLQIASLLPSQNSNYNTIISQTTPSRPEIDAIVNDLNKDNVKEALTGYWYGAPLKLWSNNTINFAVIDACNMPFNFNVRENWYYPQALTKTALIIDHSGPDAGYWPCTNQTLESIYGDPVTVQQVENLPTGENVSIWVYNYDLRTKLQPFPAAN